MLFPAGTKQILRHTGDVVVISKFSEGFYYVHLIGDSDIFTVSGDAFVTETTKTSSSSFQNSYVEQKIKLFDNAGTGISIILLPLDGGSFSVYLMNDTNKKLVFDLKVSTTNRPEKSISNIVNPFYLVFLTEIDSNFFYEAGKLSGLFWEATLSGENINETEESIRFKAKLLTKPKQSFLEFQTPVYKMDWFKSLKTPVSNQESLKSYTQSKINDSTKSEKRATNYVKKVDVWAYADFDREIDLHIEKVIPGTYRGTPKSEYLKIQLNAFEDYYYKAIQLGIESFYVIHGVGDGVLKKNIHNRLEGDMFVKSFNNKPHPKYGVGATQVILK